MQSTGDKPIVVGLRVDVDTFRGTRDGVPNLLRIFREHSIIASFFFTVGPDNMGRHLWRLLKPRFLLKMLRTKAASLYGWDIVFRGTFWPGPNIANHLAQVIKDTHSAGHEIGLHGWDHHKWQAQVETMNASEIHIEIQKGIEALNNILGFSVECSAAPGWKCTESVLAEKQLFNYKYNSDCRGTHIFRPRLNHDEGIPQIPVTLPTYDEMVGNDGVTDANYNEHLLNLIRPGQLNVLTIHAEVEGISKQLLFTDFLRRASLANIIFVPLGRLLPAQEAIPVCGIELKPVHGREGTLCWQVE